MGEILPFKGRVKIEAAPLVPFMNAKVALVRMDPRRAVELHEIEIKELAQFVQDMSKALRLPPNTTKETVVVHGLKCLKEARAVMSDYCNTD